MTAGAIWIVAGLAIAALEMIVPGCFLIWIGLAALGAGAATELTGLALTAQIAVFVLLTVGLIGTIALRQRRRPLLDTVNAPAAGLIGQTCRAIDFQDGKGRVSLGDGAWQARVADATQPLPGQALKVVGLDGTTLLVVSG